MLSCLWHDTLQVNQLLLRTLMTAPDTPIPSVDAFPVTTLTTTFHVFHAFRLSRPLEFSCSIRMHPNAGKIRCNPYGKICSGCPTDFEEPCSVPMCTAGAMETGGTVTLDTFSIDPRCWRPTPAQFSRPRLLKLHTCCLCSLEVWFRGNSIPLTYTHVCTTSTGAR